MVESYFVGGGSPLCNLLNNSEAGYYCGDGEFTVVVTAEFIHRCGLRVTRTAASELYCWQD